MSRYPMLFLCLAGCIAEVVAGVPEAGPTDGFGERIQTACGAGLVNEREHCCWPEQGWDGFQCVGTPACPSGFVVDGPRCAPEGCPSGQAKQRGGQCCWAGQVWSDSGGKCVGPLVCPQGYSEMGGGCSLDAWQSPTLGLMRGIPEGTFKMGDTQQVKIGHSFLMMESEVTQGMWQAVMGKNPSAFGDCGASCPVEKVSWVDVQDFIQKVSVHDGVRYRLPTEAEWEYAARGGQDYIYAGSDNLNAVGWYEGNSGKREHAVCQKQRNGYGLCDMSGNVWEWVEDWFDATSASARVVRGGSWSYYPQYAQVTHRYSFAPEDRYSSIGFRLVRRDFEAL